MTVSDSIIAILSGFVTDAIANATAIATSPLGLVVGFFLGAWLVFTVIRMVKGWNKAGL